MFFGVLYGCTDYISGGAISVNQQTIIKMMSFGATVEGDTSATQTTTTNANGNTVTTTTSKTQDEEVKKDFFALYEIMEYWSDLFYAQRLLKVALPYLYICMLEVAVVMIFSLTLFFY